MFAIERALKLNNNEATLMARHAGFRQVVFNMGDRLRTQMYGHSQLSDSKVINEFNKVVTDRVKKQPELPRMNLLSSRVYQNALIDRKNAFNRYRSEKSGHPTFASRRDGQSFTVDSSQVKVVLNAGNKIKIPTLGTFRLDELLNSSLVSQSFTISKEGSRWFVSFCVVDVRGFTVQQHQELAGIDVGIKAFATLSAVEGSAVEGSVVEGSVVEGREAEGSNNQVFDAPKPLKQAKTKLATLQRKASRQVIGSNNQRQTYARISRIHARISCVSKEFMNKLKTYLAQSFKLIKIQDLKVQGMMANHQLAGAIADLGFDEFKRHLTYKFPMYRANQMLIEQWFPSSKICSNCGHKQDMPLSIRTYDCSSCGRSIDRDLNASINILNWEPSA